MRLLSFDVNRRRFGMFRHFHNGFLEGNGGGIYGQSSSLVEESGKGYNCYPFLFLKNWQFDHLILKPLTI